MKKIPVGILGATGMIGQQTLRLLENHPWFQVSYLAASETSSGKTYEKAVAHKWHFAEPIPKESAHLPVHAIHEMEEAKKKCHILFSCLATESALEWEERYALEGFAILSNASCHRLNPRVPLIIPEINPDHLSILHQGKGFIIAKPNCSIQCMMLPLFPLHQKFHLKKILVTTLQSVSGAGFPGVPSLSITDNVIPHIQGEEEKSEIEPLKIFGKVERDKIIPTKEITISAHCNRVPVLDGHLACISVAFEKKPLKEEILTLWRDFKGLDLPSAPAQPVVYREEKDRPQPRLDRLAGNGMAVTVGRLRDCSLFDYRFTSLSHNTIRGGGGGSILTAELLVQKKIL
jgi:aspartate-semialdehyde dehydrogenase